LYEGGLRAKQRKPFFNEESAMTEQTPASAPEQQPVQVAIFTQYVRDFSFESPLAPQIFSQMQAQPVLDMGVNVQTRKLDGDAHEVMLMLKLEAKVDGKTAFIAELAYGGVFGIPPMPDEQMKFLLLAEAPRLLFPFARNIVSNAVRDGGFPQVLINPIDFGSLYQQQQAALNQTPQGSA
jgi:preprotein translocase subunit SecB